jgi:hypothetical protein
MGTNTTNPPAMSPEGAGKALETAMTELQAVIHLVHALAGCASNIEPEALYPLHGILSSIFERADAATDAAQPFLSAAQAGRRAA